jgi:hypothetical protein
MWWFKLSGGRSAISVSCDNDLASIAVAICCTETEKRCTGAKSTHSLENVPRGVEFGIRCLVNDQDSVRVAA